jgi:hypothetical protein
MTRWVMFCQAIPCGTQLGRSTVTENGIKIEIGDSQNYGPGYEDSLSPEDRKALENDMRKLAQARRASATDLGAVTEVGPCICAVACHVIHHIMFRCHVIYHIVF